MGIRKGIKKALQSGGQVREKSHPQWHPNHPQLFCSVKTSYLPEVSRQHPRHKTSATRCCQPIMAAARQDSATRRTIIPGPLLLPSTVAYEPTPRRTRISSKEQSRAPRATKRPTLLGYQRPPVLGRQVSLGMRRRLDRRLPPIRPRRVKPVAQCQQKAAAVHHGARSRSVRR